MVNVSKGNNLEWANKKTEFIQESCIQLFHATNIIFFLLLLLNFLLYGF